MKPNELNHLLSRIINGQSVADVNIAIGELKNSIYTLTTERDRAIADLESYMRSFNPQKVS